MRRLVPRGLCALTLVLALLPVVVSMQSQRAGAPEALPGLKAAAQITRDTNAIAHVSATNAHDVYFLQGYLHAQDRLFQMDYSRRQAAGTLAELLGPQALAADVQMRTFGLRRAAERSLPVLSPETIAALEAYAEGVNAYVAANPALPSEYGCLKAKFVSWEPVDSVAVGKLIAFGLSFDLSDIDNTVALTSYQIAGQQTKLFNGTMLFFEDLFRSAPFSTASTIPDARVAAAATTAVRATQAGPLPDVVGANLARAYLANVKDIPAVQRFIKKENRPHSNEWAIAPSHTTSGRAIVANDPHLALDTPAVWYPVHLSAGALDVIGNSFPGVPFVVLGHNRHAGWGATVNPLDVTDVFQEKVVADASSPSGLSIVHEGANEPIVPIPEAFYAVVNGTLQPMTGNGIPSATLIVPRRNNGPIIQMGTGTALSVAYTGFGATRELDTFRMFDEADSLDAFRAALPFFDFGSQNFAYADVDGNIAYFTSAEMPIRTDLQTLPPYVGAPPYFIRNGTIGANDWMPVAHRQPEQALDYEILPADEMPHIVNPPAGWFVNCNNDPAGTTLDNNPLNQARPGGGVYYLSPGYDGFRAGRVTERLRQMLAHGGRVSFEDVQAIQADTVLIDAEVFVPYISQAFDRAQATSTPALKAFALMPPVGEAVGRLRAWNFTTPTGVGGGFDAVGATTNEPSSVAATIYAVWRSRFMVNVIDSKLTPSGLPLPDDGQTLASLRNLLDNFATNQGVGVSGLPFFYVPNVTNPADARDIYILKSLSDALNLLAGDAFKQVFKNSVDQRDYQWGKLHRIVLEHPMGSVFSVPPAGGAMPPPLGPDVPGFPTDGGFGTVDVAAHKARAAQWDQFMFSHGPSNRSVHEGSAWGMHGESSLPGGVSGVLGSPWYANLLTPWLQNVAYTQWQRQNEIVAHTHSVSKFVPGK